MAGGVIVGRDDDIRLPTVDQLLGLLRCLRDLFRLLAALGIHVELAHFAAPVQGLTQTPLDTVGPGITLMVGRYEQALRQGLGGADRQPQGYRQQQRRAHAAGSTCWRQRHGVLSRQWTEARVGIGRSDIF